MEQVPTNRLNSNMALALYFVFKSIPMFISGLAIYLGYRLFILGVTGQASLSIENRAISGQLLNAAPGLFFGVGGLVVLGVIVYKGVEVSFRSRSRDEFEDIEDRLSV